MSPQPNKRLCGPPPARESFHLHTARTAFLNDPRPIDEALVDFERAVEHVLAGGYLTQMGRVPQPTEKDRQLVAAVRAHKARANALLEESQP